MNLSLTKTHIFLFIVAMIFFAHFPVVSGDFLRQDDWNAALWNIKQIPSHPEFYNSLVELARPVSTFFILIGDYFAHNLENAKYVRIFNVLLLGIASFLTYLWQIKFNSKDKIFALCFAIAAFTLPPSQLHSSTVSYGNMVISIITSQLALFCLYKIHFEETTRKNKWLLYSSAFLLLMLGFLNYALSSMFCFLFLAIVYFQTRFNHNFKDKNILFILKSSIFIIATMILYVVLVKIIFLIFNIIPRNAERSVHIDLDIIEKFKHIAVMIKYSFNIFDISGLLHLNFLNNAAYYPSWKVAIVIFAILLIYLTIEAKKYYKNDKKIIFYPALHLVVIFSLLVLSYCPALAPKPIFTTFRYLPVTMPFALFILMWSIYNIFSISSFEKYGINKKLVAVIACFGIILSNLNLSNYIVGPHLHEMNYIRSHIENEVLPVINKEKVTIRIIQKPVISFAKNQFSSQEYGLPVDFSTNWLMSATTFLMRQYGYESIPDFKVIEWSEKRIYMTTPWGAILALPPQHNNFRISDKSHEIIIDMNKLGTFR